MTLVGQPLALLAAFILLGGIAGAGFFLSLRRIVNRYLQGGPAWRPAVLQALRLLLLGGLFWLAARHGAAALLSMLGGFVLARLAVVRPAPRTP